MTEYWVSQGNKWCNFCKIYIANNQLSIRTHELGKRHKDNVAKRLDTMKKESAAKEKEQKEASRALEQIESKAKRSYQKDLASFREFENSSNQAVESQGPDLSKGWELVAASGYYYNKVNGYHYDPKTRLYYSNNLGKWVTHEEAFTADASRPNTSHSASQQTFSTAQDGTASKTKGGAAPGLVVPTSLNPMRSVKGAPSSIAATKRKREDGKTKPISKEEEAALKAREAAKRRVEEREKPLLGLYRHRM